MRSEGDAHRAIERYADMVWRLCLINLKNPADAEDVFQNVFMKYVLSSAVFQSEEHEKAWFIRVTVNACRDLYRSLFRRESVPIDELPELPYNDNNEENREVLDAVMALPEKYRDVVYLHYYEGYSAPEISKILHKNVNTIYTLLTRARNMLRESLGGDGGYEQ